MNDTLAPAMILSLRFDPVFVAELFLSIWPFVDHQHINQHNMLDQCGTVEPFSSTRSSCPLYLCSLSLIKVYNRKNVTTNTEFRYDWLLWSAASVIPVGCRFLRSINRNRNSIKMILFLNCVYLRVSLTFQRMTVGNASWLVECLSMFVTSGVDYFQLHASSYLIRFVDNNI